MRCLWLAVVGLAVVGWASFQSADVAQESAAAAPTSVDGWTPSYAGPVQPRDEELLRSLDDGNPALEGICAARDRGDTLEALNRYLAYLQTRDLVDRDVLVPVPAAAAKASVIQRANECLERKYRLAGCDVFTMPESIDDWTWTEDPFGYDQWTIALNRHEHWRVLGDAYRLTGDERYAQEFERQLLSWASKGTITIKRNDGRNSIESPDYVARSRMLTLDSGLRMGSAWPQAYVQFRDAREFTGNARLEITAQFMRHARFLSRSELYNSQITNQNLMCDTGLLMVGLLCPEFKESRRWVDTALQRIRADLDALFYVDGTGKELTTLYQGVNLDQIEQLVQLAMAMRSRSDQVNRLILSRDPQDKVPSALTLLERGSEFYARIAFPPSRHSSGHLWRTVPDINDGSNLSIEDLMGRGARFFPERKDFAWLTHPTAPPADTTPPEYQSIYLPWAGWSVMRTGWSEDDVYLFFRGGPAGTSHQHEDKLNLIVNVAGKTLLTEAGRYAYDFSEWEEAAVSATGHNTVRVADASGVFQGQHRRKLPQTWEAKQPVENYWVSTDEVDFAAAVYTDGFGAANDLKVAHERQVLFMKPAYWLVIDTLRADGPETQNYEALFHLDTRPDEPTADAIGRAVEQMGTSFTALAPRDPQQVDAGSVGLKLIPLGTNQQENLSLALAQSADDHRSFVSTPVTGQRKPVQTAVYTWSAKGLSIRAWLLIPSVDGQTWPEVTLVSAGGEKNSLTLLLSRANGGQDRVTVRWARRRGQEQLTTAVISKPTEFAAFKKLLDSGPRRFR